MISQERKQELIKQFALSSADTGSVEVQIAVLTERIQLVSQHLQNFTKDEHSRLGLLKLVGQKRRLMRYLKNNNAQSYESVVAKLKSI